MDNTFEQIYKIVEQIPRGKVATYGQIAQMLGNPRMSRVVGYALHVSPDSRELPCHRVVNRFGGLSAAFEACGINQQELLLVEEGVVFTKEGTVDMQRCLWDGRPAEKRGDEASAADFIKAAGPAGKSAALAMAWFEEAGFEGYLVGGCVRDILMGKMPEDIDMATTALPEATLDIFQRRGKTLETGRKHGTVTVFIDNSPLEITTCRIDGGYMDHRRPAQVSFTSHIEEDLARRDFTINAMAWSLHSGLLDPFGGAADLRWGRIRCVGEPDQRFEEDALRILRALRFSSKLGFPIEEQTEKAMRAKKELLAYISPERIFSELKKIIKGEFVRAVLLRSPDILGVVIPEIMPMVGFSQNNPHHIYDVWTHSVAALCALNDMGGFGDGQRLAALFHDIGKPCCYSEDEKGVGHFFGHAAKGQELTETILERLRADTKTKELTLDLIKYHDVKIAEEKRIIKRWLSRRGTEFVRSLLWLKRADNMGQDHVKFDRQPQYKRLQAMVEEVIADGECFSLRQLAVNGSDLMEAGISQGPEVGRILRLLLAAVVNGEAANEKRALLDFAAREGIMKEEC